LQERAREYDDTVAHILDGVLLTHEKDVVAGVNPEPNVESVLASPFMVLTSSCRTCQDKSHTLFCVYARRVASANGLKAKMIFINRRRCGFVSGFTVRNQRGRGSVHLPLSIKRWLHLFAIATPTQRPLIVVRLRPVLHSFAATFVGHVDQFAICVCAVGGTTGRLLRITHGFGRSATCAYVVVIFEPPCCGVTVAQRNRVHQARDAGPCASGQF
jgi:hypothetical protein